MAELKILELRVASNTPSPSPPPPPSEEALEKLRDPEANPGSRTGEGAESVVPFLDHPQTRQPKQPD